MLKTQKVENGETAKAPKNVKRDGYTFIGWNKEFSEVTSDMTVVAQYEKVEEDPAITEEPSTGDPVPSVPASGNSTMTIVIIAVVAVIAVAVVVLVVVKKKKQ